LVCFNGPIFNKYYDILKCQPSIKILLKRNNYFEYDHWQTNYISIIVVCLTLFLKKRWLIYIVWNTMRGGVFQQIKKKRYLLSGLKVWYFIAFFIF
jgi:hypothetical protein